MKSEYVQYSSKYDHDCLKRSRDASWSLSTKKELLLCLLLLINESIQRLKSNYSVLGCLHGNMKVRELFILNLLNWGNTGILRINDKLSEMFVTCHEIKKKNSTTCLLDSISSLVNINSVKLMWLHIHMYKCRRTHHHGFWLGVE